MALQTFNLFGGYKIPVVGLGTFTVTNEQELVKALNVALETGYRHIDTAELYRNEHVVGQVLKQWFDFGKLKREDVFVTTKLPGSGIHPDRVERYLKQSLEKLQLDYVDLYLMHVPICTTEIKPGETNYGAKPEPTDLIGTWKKLEEQVDLGRVRAIGVSNFNQEQVSRIIAFSRIKPAANQVELHVQLQQKELVKYCQDNGVQMISYSSLGNPGINAYLKNLGMPTRPGYGDALKDPFVTIIADKHKKSPAHVLLKFLIQKNIAVIPKSTTPKRIQDNFKLFDFTLDKADIKALEALDRENDGRLAWMDFSPEYLNHPEYPFPKRPS